SSSSRAAAGISSGRAVITVPSTRIIPPGQSPAPARGGYGRSASSSYPGVTLRRPAAPPTGFAKPEPATAQKGKCMGLAFPPSLSPSSVSAFKSCPLAFRFSYIDRLPEPPSAAATKGTLVHRALELLMLRPPDERTVVAALADLATARIEMADHPELAGLELSDEEWAAFDGDAEELGRRYFQLEDPRTVSPNGLELKLTAQFGRVTLRGIIDRLEIDEDGELVVTDYKTGSVPSEYAENARLSGVHIYAALCEQMLGKRP